MTVTNPDAGNGTGTGVFTVHSYAYVITSQPSTATAGTSFSVTVVAKIDGATDTAYTGSGHTLTWGGASNSPSGTPPTLPTNPTFSSGSATFSITLVNAVQRNFRAD